MRIKCDFLYAVIDGRRGLYDANGNIVSLDNLLKQFHPDKDAGVPVRIIADDGRHDEVPFDLATAKSIVGQKKRAFFCTDDGRKATVYSVSAVGEYPVIGLDPTGRPCLWDKNGFPENGVESLRLYIQEEVEPNPAAGVDGEEARENEAPGNGIGDADPADEEYNPLDEM